MSDHIKEDIFDFRLVGILIENIYETLKTDIEGIILKGDYSEVLNGLRIHEMLNFIEADFGFLLRNFCIADSPVRFDYQGKDSAKYEKEIIAQLKDDKINALYGELNYPITYSHIMLIKERIQSKSGIDLKFSILGNHNPSFHRNEYTIINC